MERNREVRLWIGLIALVGLFFAAVFLPGRFRTNTATSTAPVVKSNPFAHLSLNARAVYVYDLLNNRVIYSKNADLAQPLASITKLMTMLVASEVLAPNDVITISSSSLATEGDNGLKLNEKWYFKDLADFTLFVSSNDGANAIALAAAPHFVTPLSRENNQNLNLSSTTTLEQIFVKEMNLSAANLGFSSLHFQNETGLDIDPITPGAVGSAKDISRLMEYILKNQPQILEITKYNDFQFKSVSGIVHAVSNTDKAISKISYIIASKTGYTNLAGGNLTVIYNVGLNHPVIITVLGSTDSDRFTDVVALASSTSAYILSQ